MIAVHSPQIVPREPAVRDPLSALRTFPGLFYKTFVTYVREHCYYLSRSGDNQGR